VRRRIGPYVAPRPALKFTYTALATDFFEINIDWCNYLDAYVERYIYNLLLLLLLFISSQKEYNL